MMKKSFVIFMAMLCFVYAFTGCDTENGCDDGRGYSLNQIGDLLAEKTSAADVDFRNTGIQCYDENGNLIPKTVEDYRKLYYLSEENLIGYYRMLHEDKAETEKLVCALGYESWNDFLTQKGHLNSEGEADVRVWVESVYVQLQKEYDEACK